MPPPPPSLEAEDSNGTTSTVGDDEPAAAAAMAAAAPAGGGGAVKRKLLAAPSPSPPQEQQGNGVKLALRHSSAFVEANDPGEDRFANRPPRVRDIHVSLYVCFFSYWAVSSNHHQQKIPPHQHTNSRRRPAPGPVVTRRTRTRTGPMGCTPCWMGTGARGRRSMGHRYFFSLNMSIYMCVANDEC
jgi:hypothetical protein